MLWKKRSGCSCFVRVCMHKTCKENEKGCWSDSYPSSFQYFGSAIKRKETIYGFGMDWSIIRIPLYIHKKQEVKVNERMNSRNAVYNYYLLWMVYFEIKMTTSGYCCTKDPIEMRNRPRLRTMWTSRVGIRKIGAQWENKWNANREWVGNNEFHIIDCTPENTSQLVLHTRLHPLNNNSCAMNTPQATTHLSFTGKSHFHPSHIHRTYRVN